MKTDLVLKIYGTTIVLKVREVDITHYGELYYCQMIDVLLSLETFVESAKDLTKRVY